MENSYLIHHGIKGQKWGVRRYQNADGSLTDSGKKRYSKNLYKDLKKNPYDHTSNNYKSNKLVKSISEDSRIKQAKSRLDNTKYDGPKDFYEPSSDPKVIKKAVESFEKKTGEKFDPNNKQHSKWVESESETIADKMGLYKKADKINSAPNWEAAYKNYDSVKTKVINEYLGDYANIKVNTLRGSENMASVVNHMLYEIDQDNKR